MPVSAPRVTIGGGGIAGIAAALRLAERGYAVTLYEEKSMLGGNLASRDVGQGRAFDVYPHMFEDWYENFWALLRDAGVDRDESFSAVSCTHMLRKREFPKFSTLTRPYSPRYLLQNLVSGVAPPIDMFVLGCASLDLLAEPVAPTVNLRNLSLTGYLNSRPYMTETAIEAFEALISRVWAIPAYQISAADCRAHSAYCYAAPETDLRLTRSPSEDAFIAPLKQALLNKRVRIVLCTRIEDVDVKDGRVRTITLQPTTFDPRTYEWVKAGPMRTETIDDLLLAVPPKALAKRVRMGPRGHRIVDAARELAELARLRAKAVPLVHLCFTRQLPDIPREPVALFDSTLNLAFTDISQHRPDSRAYAGRTALAVSCSERHMLTGPTWQDDAHAIVCELADYLDFESGTRWGEARDIDWRFTRYYENADAQQTVDAIGTDDVRPPATCEGVDNLFFAGDFCRSDFGITTVEAAVATGLAAAGAIVSRRGVGDAVEVLTPRTLPAEEYALLRLAWMPAAAAGKAISLLTGQRAEDTTGGKDESLLRYMLTPGLPPRHRRPDA